jgi:NitT/TauT family transport system permease protein
MAAKRLDLLPLREDIPRRYYLSTSAFFLILLFIVWGALTYSNIVSPIFLPTPTAIAQAALAGIQDGSLWENTRVSVYRIMVGWLISTLFALPIGLLMGNFRFFEALFEPPIGFVRYMPAVAFIPLSILWTGVGDTQKFVILFIGTFFQEVLMISDNVKHMPKDLIRVSYTLGLGKWEVLTQVIMPYSLPGILDTLRITLGWAWTYLVVAELVAASTGLGYSIMRAQRYLQTDKIILGILVIGLLGLISDYIFKFLYVMLFPWTRSGRG